MSKLRDALLKYSSGAGCSVEILVRSVPGEGDRKRLERVKLEFSGPIAHIPSLKNSKLPGRNFINPTTAARLKVMDYTYKQSIEKTGLRIPISFGNDDVALVVVCASRKVSFDTDNCLATIRDWLEPPIKKVGKGKGRGWGVGLVNNDRQVKGLALYDKDLGMKLDKSIIILQRYDKTRDKLIDFVHDAFFDISEGIEKWVVN